MFKKLLYLGAFFVKYLNVNLVIYSYGVQCLFAQKDDIELERRDTQYYRVK